jgi:DNA invertase Pin-like site-specific DNA recombinase
MANKTKRAAIYLRVSTSGQTVENQRRELEQVAQRRGWSVVEVYQDEGISGAKGRDKRLDFDRMLRRIRMTGCDLGVDVTPVERTIAGERGYRPVYPVE